MKDESKKRSASLLLRLGRLAPLPGAGFFSSFVLHPSSLRSGFTLLEILVAMVIFTMVLASLFTAFRSGTKAYDIGQTHSEGEQAARYAISQISDDLHNVFYKSAGLYNVTRRQREAVLAQREEQALKSGTTYDPLSDPNAPELGPQVDLSFKASDGGETDEITFVRLQSLKHGEDRKPWGLARLKYHVAGSALYRSVDDIYMPESNEYGEELPKPTVAQVDKIANNVKSLDMKFGYFFDKEWVTAEDWDSGAARYRNPPEEDEDEQIITQVTTATQAQRIKVDDLPAWVEITFTFTDPKKVEKEKVYRQIVQLPQSQETYLPPDADGDAARHGAFDRRRGRR